MFRALMFTLLTALLIPVIQYPAFARQKVTIDDIVNLPHAAVPAPTKFLDELRSSDAQVRVKALKLFGAAPPYTNVNANGEDYTISSGAALRYGYCKKDGDLAVITLQMRFSKLACFLIRSVSGWERIGIFGTKAIGDSPEGFVELQPVLQWPQTDIVVHGNGGGTGLYDRELTIFRVRNGRLESIYETTDKEVDCHPTENKNYCTITEGKIEFSHILTRPALITAELESIEPTPNIHFPCPPCESVPSFEVYKSVHRISCEVLLWNSANAQFSKSQKWTQVYCGRPSADVKKAE